MRILISADIEGISGVCLPEQTSPGSQEYERARRLMTAEVNAAVLGILDACASEKAASAAVSSASVSLASLSSASVSSASVSPAVLAPEIWVADGHGPYRNIILEELHPAACLVSGKPRFLGMLAGLAEAGPWDGLFLIGCHSRAGAYGVLSHTINGAAFHLVRINGQAVGEAFINSALAGEYGVPVRLVSGDDCLAEEVRPYLPEVELVVVKRALGHRAAAHRSPASVHADLRAAAARSLARSQKAHCRQGPFVVEVSTVRPVHADCFAQVPGVRREGPSLVSFQGARMEDVSHFLNTFSAMSASLG